MDYHSSNVQDDGYTREGYLDARERIHSPLRFSYRPLMATEVQEAEDTQKTLRGKAAMKFLAAILASHLVKWSECELVEGKPDPAKPRPITAENVGRLNYQLVADLKLVVFGYAAGDPLPGATDEQTSDFVASALAYAAGDPPGLVALEAQRKN